MNQQQREELTSLLGERIAWDVSMAQHSTFRAGGRAEALADVISEDELAALLQWLTDNAIRWRIIGRGSNILVSGRGFAGVIIRLQGRFLGIGRTCESVGSGARSVVIRVGGGCSMARLVAWCAGQALCGLEFLAGIPGSVGGGVRMNAGAWGQSMGECLQSVRLLDSRGNRYEVEAADLVLSYRKLGLALVRIEEMIITGANFVLQCGRQAEILELCRCYLARRREKQPAGVGSAGSFFKNPDGDYAGRLIEAAGLKGLSRGDAMVSPKHANFIVNTGRATAADIAALMEEVQERVYRESGIHLEPEVHIL